MRTNKPILQWEVITPEEADKLRCKKGRGSGGRLAPLLDAVKAGRIVKVPADSSGHFRSTVYIQARRAGFRISVRTTPDKQHCIIERIGGCDEGDA